MAPVRRYLRISKYSVLECRIYVDNPSLVPSWLLHPRNPVLPRVIESVRPLVLPKLMEERERAKKKGTKKKGAIRDVLVEDDFEVSLFLTETNTRHSLLYKHRRARDKTQTRLVSNSSKLTGGTSDAPIGIDEGGASNDLRVDLGEDGEQNGDASDDDIVLTATGVGSGRKRPTDGQDEAPPNLLLEHSDDEVPVALGDIPDIQSAQPIKLEDDADGNTAGLAARRPKRRRQDTVQIQDSDDDNGDGSDNDSLFVSENGEDDMDVDLHNSPAPKRTRIVPPPGNDDDNDGESSQKKKKLAMDVIYEGFAIYGRVLCLVVKRRGGPFRGRGAGGGTQTTLSASTATGRAGNPSSVSAEPVKPGGQAAMENWIASTQMPAAQDMS
ncbi:hypothetical protein SCUCBS95973_003680 [Sporothrix curviconia]|uniref:Uncharacterized protein n=1 Tax=Sporothrix curviconia TaxID=1260050 RepID=A0ABP0BIS5_9PEZI